MSAAIRSTAPRVTRLAQARLGVLLALPVVTIMVVFFLVPMTTTFYYAFVDFNGFSPNPPFVGFANFERLVTDPRVGTALLHNLTWIVVGTAVPMLLGLIIAILLWSVRRGSVVYRVAFFLPYILPGVAIGIVWGWIYDPVHGVLNEALRSLGLESLARGWLGDPDLALFAVLATAIWASMGFIIVVFLSALRNVDTDLVEAARIDGANAAQRIWYILIPQIMPVFLMVLTLTLVGGFAVFDLVFIMTKGGPAGATDVLGTYAYANAFRFNNISYGTVLALMITVLSVPIAVILNRVQRRLSQQGLGA